MTQRVQTIGFNGAPVAIVADGEARIVAGLSESEERTVKGMCLFALEIQGGAIDPPYTDRRALSYARLADVRRTRTSSAS